MPASREAAMRVRRLDSAQEFHDRAGTWLARREAENNLMLGVVMDLIASPDRWGEAIYYAVVEDGAGVVTAALRTPPWNLIVARASAVALDLLVDDLAGEGTELPGVLGPAEAADHVAARWAARSGLPTRKTMSMRVFQLTRVIPPRPVEGALRRVTRGELPLLTEWMKAFHRDAGVHAPVPPAAIAREALQDGRAYLWDDRGAVSLAVWNRETPHGVGVTAVYTPRSLRGRGYASAAVAALSQRLLDGGRRMCFLFTDLANPTANHIYQAIGYEPVADFTTHSFGDEATVRA